MKEIIFELIYIKHVRVCSLMIEHKEGVLAIGAHPDDIELGCGASLARMAKDGYHIVAVVMTAGKAGCNTKTDRHIESMSALQSLGCKQVFHFDFEDTKISHSVDLMIKSLEDVVTKKIPSQVNITRVYTMYHCDRHQDHCAVYKASIVACRHIPQILEYETPSSYSIFNPQVFESISEDLFVQKLHALSYHQSQKHRNYMQENQLRSVAKFRGLQAGCELSEGFVAHRMVLLK